MDFDLAMNLSIKKAKERIQKCNPELRKELERLLDIAIDGVHKDYDRRDPLITRKYPNIIGKCYNYSDDYKDAALMLVDSSTDPSEMMEHIKIHAKVFRPYVPERGNKNLNSYRISVGHSLYNKNDNIQYMNKIANDVINTEMKDGMYVSGLTFRKYAPRICILYCNINHKGKRMALMLRPSDHFLNKGAYPIYSFLVANSIILRSCGGSFELGLWKKLATLKSIIDNSMLIKDHQLVTKNEEIKRIYCQQIKLDYTLCKPDSLMTSQLKQAA